MVHAISWHWMVDFNHYISCYWTCQCHNSLPLLLFVLLLTIYFYLPMILFCCSSLAECFVVFITFLLHWFSINLIYTLQIEINSYFTKLWCVSGVLSFKVPFKSENDCGWENVCGRKEGHWCGLSTDQRQKENQTSLPLLSGSVAHCSSCCPFSLFPLSHWSLCPMEDT